MPPVSVLLAFKQPLVMSGVRNALAVHDDLRIVAECATLHGTLRAVKKHRPRVVIAGSGICEEDLSSLEGLALAAPDTRIALFCMRSADILQHALLHGASAVLPPDTGPEHLLECVRALAGGKHWRPPAKLRAAGDRPRTGAREASTTILAVLSVRERQIAHAVATGKRNREIAEAFGISPGTVKLHINRIYSKLGVNSRLALFRKLLSEANLPL